MVSLPSPTKVAGSHNALYESYYNLVDPHNHGHVGPKEAADLLKKSHLSETVLIKIWDIADPNSRGYLDKAGMFVALKLCALAQQGHDLNISNIYLDIFPPKMSELKNDFLTPDSNWWSITNTEREKYQLLFQSLEPINGYVSGNKVKAVLMDSKLPLETLGKIWDLADIDRDGKLNLHEFIIAMHLVYKALENHAIPSTVPIELLSLNKIIVTETSPKIQSINSGKISKDLVTNNCIPDNTKKAECKWVVSIDDQKAADKLFIQADKDLDGFVSGSEIKDVFFQSGLPQPVLADIWSLCDISQSGKLNKEQFALSMWLIKQKLNKLDLPTSLTPDMIPPSFRKPKVDNDKENTDVSSYTNPELDIINKDIIEIVREKHMMEQDISQREADIKIKNGEIKSLQSELDTLAATLRQLDNQKGEAQKRLNDLRLQVDKLRLQAEDQELTLHSQEEELNNKRQEIESLKIAEQNLEKEQNECKNKLNLLSNDSQNTQLKISQAKAKITQLEEQQRQLIDAITQYDTALSKKDASNLSESVLLFKTKIEISMYYTDDQNNITKELSELDNNQKEEPHNDNKETDTFSSFHDDFDQRPKHLFKEFQTNEVFSTDPFNKTNGKSYDPFSDRSQINPPTDTIQVKDPFGEDPFAALHAPVKLETASPALPPKKNKQPPPRPAPPKSTQTSQSLSQDHSLESVTSVPQLVTDPFADKVISMDNSRNDAFGFADFANFDPKV